MFEHTDIVQWAVVYLSIHYLAVGMTFPMGMAAQKRAIPLSWNVCGRVIHCFSDSKQVHWFHLLSVCFFLKENVDQTSCYHRFNFLKWTMPLKRSTTVLGRDGRSRNIKLLLSQLYFCYSCLLTSSVPVLCILQRTLWNAEVIFIRDKMFVKAALTYFTNINHLVFNFSPGPRITFCSSLV